MSADLSFSGGAKIFLILIIEKKFIMTGDETSTGTHNNIIRAIISANNNTPVVSPAKKPATKVGLDFSVIDVVSSVTLIRVSKVNSMQPFLVIALSNMGHCLFNLIALP